MAEPEAVPRVGSHWIACDGAGDPPVILQTVWLKIGTFKDAEADSAMEEGEDDKSLESWRHERAKEWRRTEASRGRA